MIAEKKIQYKGWKNSDKVGKKGWAIKERKIRKLIDQAWKYSIQPVRRNRINNH